MPTADRTATLAHTSATADAILSHPQLRARVDAIIAALRADLAYSTRTGTDPAPITRTALSELLAGQSDPTTDRVSEALTQLDAIRPYLDALDGLDDLEPDRLDEHDELAPDHPTEHAPDRAAPSPPADTHLTAIVDDLARTIRHSTPPSPLARVLLPALVRRADHSATAERDREAARRYADVREFVQAFRHVTDDHTD
jgi:hypothetical protein